MPEDLRTALDSVLAPNSVDALGRSVGRLIEAYRSGRLPASPILADPIDAAAYAAYRMPATYAAVAACLRALCAAAPEFAPARLLDLGGGTGAAAWACADRFPSLANVTVADGSSEALAVGRSLARSSSAQAMRDAAWVKSVGFAASLPSADLVTISYVLGELAPPAQTDLVRRAVAAGGAVLIVEPGTPAGHSRVLAARSQLIDAGLRIVAPCPHTGTCPLTSADWCHFGARVNRSALHRRIKGASLSYEDEKFSYVIGAPFGGTTVSRVLRRPVQRKNLVSLRLCRSDGGFADQIVTKRAGVDVYRAARDIEWGDPWA